MKVNGNLAGIKDSNLDLLEKIYDMEVKQGEVLSSEIMDIIIPMTAEIQREISVFVNRRGKVIDVSIGDANTVNLTAFDYRRGSRRLSGVRCIHTHPNERGILSSVDISALVNLRLDLVAAIGVRKDIQSDIYIGVLNPKSGQIGESYKAYGPFTAETLGEFNAAKEIKIIEKSIDASIPEEVEEKEKERVLLIGLCKPGEDKECEDLLSELEELSETAGCETVGKIIQKKSKIDSAYYIGRGKAQELNLLRQSYNIDTIIFDDELSGAQVRNLEDAAGAKIIDRTMLILDIFARRALTREGKLQVELAQLKYMMPRLIGLGKVLSRTGGGIGTRGPGEKKLELDRRHIKERVHELEEELEEVKKNRNIQREKRRSSNVPIISLVGYTNSGKSTLRNKLSHLYQCDNGSNKEDVLEADMLFATLDPTTRLIKLPKGKEVLVSDTVGFIRKLPHELVNAFRATLEEVIYSDMLIHVVDASAENARDQINAVNNVLMELGASKKPIIIALNKIDKISNPDDLIAFHEFKDDMVEISALKGDGIERLIDKINSKLFSDIKIAYFKIPYTNMAVKSGIYRDSKILSEDYDETSLILEAEADKDTILKYKEFYIGDKQCTK